MQLSAFEVLILPACRAVLIGLFVGFAIGNVVAWLNLGVEQLWARLGSSGVGPSPVPEHVRFHSPTQPIGLARAHVSHRGPDSGRTLR